MIRLALAIAALALLTACPKEDPKNPHPTPPPPPPTLAEQIKTLEDSGVYPKLDRSTDLKGPDQNGNGVRDDIEAWIAAQPMTEKQKRSAMLKAEGFQKKLLVDVSDKAAVQKLMNESILATACLADAYAPNREEGYKVEKQMEAMNTSTKERLIRYMKYSAALSGMSFRSPTNYTCP